ncbi:MAG: hypothetical protein KAT14_07300 [Candidatus Marinimicrobia bacterium]|nr:hypothetical protein [Candidatus Neomarinimicrobiota bacterium]
MSKKFQNKYRIESTRLQNWNYGWNADYFVTIKTKDRKPYFGKIVHGEMVLTKIGEIVQSEWLKTPDIRPDMNLKLGAWIVMPNHFHAIITIGKNQYNLKQNIGSKDAMHRISTMHQFGAHRKNLASIIRGFKSSVTTYAQKHHIIFGWQSRFYDRIINDSIDYMKCEHYIRNNPKNW